MIQEETERFLEEAKEETKGVRAELHSASAPFFYR